MALERQEVGRRIAAARVGKGLTQEEAAHEIGVSVRNYQRWEEGKTFPRPGNLSALSDLFEVDVGELVGDGTTFSDRLERLEDAVAEMHADLAWLRTERAAGEALPKEPAPSQVRRNGRTRKDRRG